MVRRHEERNRLLPREKKERKKIKMLLLSLCNFVSSAFFARIFLPSHLWATWKIFLQPVETAQKKQRAASKLPVSHNIFHTSILLQLIAHWALSTYSVWANNWRNGEWRTKNEKLEQRLKISVRVMCASGENPCMRAACACVCARACSCLLSHARLTNPLFYLFCSCLAFVSSPHWRRMNVGRSLIVWSLRKMIFINIGWAVSRSVTNLSIPRFCEKFQLKMNQLVKSIHNQLIETWMHLDIPSANLHKLTRFRSSGM